MPSKADDARRQHVCVCADCLRGTQRMWGTETRLSPKYGGHQRRHPPAQAKRERCAECCARGEPAAPLVQIRRVAE